MPEQEELRFIGIEEVAEIDQVAIAGFDPNADANADLPPLAPGIYLVKVKFQSDDEAHRWMWKPAKNGKEGYMMAQVIYTVVEHPSTPKEYVGRTLYDNAMTMISIQIKSSRSMAILQACEQGDLVFKTLAKPESHGAQRRALDAALKAEPLMGVEVDWEARLWDKDAKKNVFTPIRGAKNFPIDSATGERIPFVMVPGHGEIKAVNFIKKYHTARDLGAAIEKAAAKNDEEGVIASAAAEEDAQVMQTHVPPPPPVAHRATVTPATGYAPQGGAPRRPPVTARTVGSK